MLGTLWNVKKRTMFRLILWLHPKVQNPSSGQGKKMNVGLQGIIYCVFSAPSTISSQIMFAQLIKLIKTFSY